MYSNSGCMGNRRRKGLYSAIIGAVIFFLILPLIFSRLFGWRGGKAQIGLIIIAGLYWLYNWYVD